jgi:hypothetical protein
MASWEGCYESHTEMVLTDNLQTLKVSHILRYLEPYPADSETGPRLPRLLALLNGAQTGGAGREPPETAAKGGQVPAAEDAGDVWLLHKLASGEYISQQRNVIFLGKSGTGKTHLATALGVEACRQGINTRFVTGCGLANELLEARQGLGLSRIIKRYARYDLLILDELG